MAQNEPPVIMHSALRRLAEEARQRAASLEAAAPEHDFYVGVITAAEDLSRHGNVRPLTHEKPQFRDGYLAVANMVAAGSGHTPSRLPLPTPGPS